MHYFPQCEKKPLVFAPQHFGGHPKRVTLLGRGTGATLVTALTSTPKARGLFQRAWAAGGSGAVAETSLRDANIENQVLLSGLRCSDVLECLRGADAAEVWRQTSKDW